jgi:hypothetical protein
MKRFFLAIALCALVSAPAHADQGNDRNSVPVGFDLATRALFGIPLTIVGAVAMIPVGFVTAITRPTEMRKPFDMLVMGPVRYTWVDPLGEHPEPDQATRITATSHRAPRPIEGE